MSISRTLPLIILAVVGLSSVYWPFYITALLMVAAVYTQGELFK